MSSTPASTWGWLATTPTNAAPDTAEAAHNVQCPQGVVLEKVPAVQHGADQVLHVVGLLG